MIYSLFYIFNSFYRNLCRTSDRRIFRDKRKKSADGNFHFFLKSLIALETCSSESIFLFTKIVLIQSFNSRFLNFAHIYCFLFSVFVLLTSNSLQILLTISPAVFPLFLTVCLFQKGGGSSQWDAGVEY